MNRYSRWILLMLALVVLVVVVFFNMTGAAMPGPPGGPGEEQGTSQAPSAKTNNKDTTGKAADVAAPDVSVVSVQPDNYQAEVAGFGVARPRYEIALKSQVTGQVSSIAEGFDTGRRLKKGESLLSLDDSNYLTALASAQSGVAEAKLQLLEEEREAVEARSEWKSAGLKGRPTSELVLHAPQLKVAKAVLKNAVAALTQAQRDVTHTKLISPFDALVVERLVAPGSFVQTGSEVATLYGSKQLQIDIALPAGDWQNLPAPDVLGKGDWPVKLYSVDNEQSWSGRVNRLELHLDETTRQRALVVSVDDPFDQTPALLPGTFLKVSIEGEDREGLWKLPSSSLSQRGEVWFVDAEHRLNSFPAQLVFSKADSIFIEAPKDLANSAQNVLISPLNSYLKGMLVTPIIQTQSAGNTHE